MAKGVPTPFKSSLSPIPIGNLNLSNYDHNKKKKKNPQISSMGSKGSENSTKKLEHQIKP